MLSIRIEAHRSSMARNRWMSAPGRAIVAVAMAVVAALVLGACVGDPPEVTIDDPVLEQGRDIYRINCASCHGVSGDGGVGLKLSEGTVADRFPVIEDQIDLVTNGRDAMPAYVDRLSEEEIDAVVRYTREVL